MGRHVGNHKEHFEAGTACPNCPTAQDMQTATDGCMRTSVIMADPQKLTFEASSNPGL